MKLTENQLVTVLLLIETATVSESELKLAWELHDLIQKHRSETPINSPTCDKCDCVAGCQANPALCPNVAVQPTTGWEPGMLQDDSRDFSRWLSTRVNAKQEARDAIAQPVKPAVRQGGAG